jgi:hypothetical protein
MLEITGAIRKAKEGTAFGGLPTRQTCQLAGPPVYEPASHPASAAAVCQWSDSGRLVIRKSDSFRIPARRRNRCLGLPT